MKIVVLGSGYVGLVTAAGLAELGHSVLAVDLDAERIAGLRQGKVPFYEPGLGELVSRTSRGRRLHFAIEIESEFRTSDIYFIAVGTPAAADGRADTAGVLAAAEQIATVAAAPGVIAVKSTVPVGTCDAVEARVRAVAQHPLTVAYSPEFLKEGAALEDFFRPDRVIVGADDERAARVMRDLYGPLQLSSERLVIIDRHSAELSKYAANAMLAVRISFMNDLARLCDRLGADVNDVRKAIGSDRRIGRHFLYAGPGYGGSCLPKDTHALASSARDVGIDLALVRAAIDVNRRQREYVLERLLSLFPEGIAGSTIALWGLAFKPETDDVRDAPAGFIAKSVLERGASIRAHDPVAVAGFAKAYAPTAEYFDNEYDALDGADALVVMTEWRHFRNPDFAEIERRMRQPKIVDARNIWAVHELDRRGFEYRGIGTRAGRAG